MQTVLEISGFMDDPALEQAVGSVSRAHPRLTRGFRRDADGRPTGFDAPGVALGLRSVDLRRLDTVERDTAALRLAEHERCEYFPPSVPPLIRLLLLRTGDRTRRLVVTSHRLLLDDWSHAAFLHALLDALGAVLGPGGTDQRRQAGRGAFDGWRGRMGIGAFHGGEEPIRLTRELAGHQAWNPPRHGAGPGVDAENGVQEAWAFALRRLTSRGEMPKAGRGMAIEAVARLVPGPIGPVNPRLGVRVSTLSTFDVLPYPLCLSVQPGATWIARLDYQASVLPVHVAEVILADTVAFLEAKTHVSRSRVIAA